MTIIGIRLKVKSMKTVKESKVNGVDKKLNLKESTTLIERLNAELYQKYPFLIYVTPPKRHELATDNPFETQSSCV